MIKIGIIGAAGRMGSELIKIILNNNDLKLVSAVVSSIQSIEKLKHIECVTTSLEDAFQKADLIIEFTNAKIAVECSKLANKYKKILVSGTTGLNNEQLSEIKKNAENTKILYSANMSIGIAVIKKMLAISSKILNNYDISIVDIHHNKKKDSPSGTALSLEQIIKQNGVNKVDISSIKAGGIIGDHNVMFTGEKEMITIAHRALDRSIFAEGAIQAGLKLTQFQNNGFYTLDHILDK